MVTPRNMLLMACHVTNCSLQIYQMSRYYQYEYMGGKEQVAKEAAAQ